MNGVSVIIPVYNRANKIERCLESVIKSSYENLQIIVIDDGSWDKSGEILANYAAKDVRILLIGVDNGGVSQARNIGIKLAIFEYIVFVDSDDFITDSMIEKFVDSMRKHKIDCVECNHSTNESSLDSKPTNNYKFTLFEKDIVEQSVERLTGFDSEPSIYSPVVWGKCFKRQLLLQHGICFREGRYHGEDWEFVVKYLCNCERIAKIDESLYYFSLPETTENLSARYRPEFFDIGITERETFMAIAPWLDWNREDKILDFLSTPRCAVIYYRTHCGIIKSIKWLNYIVDKTYENEEYKELAKEYSSKNSECYYFEKSQTEYKMYLWFRTTPRVIKNKIKKWLKK